ncbi:hypothetical protein [Haloflavibacter putidus]|uniref:Uncharacterized protein n=1 Tax=Haloflavibacter putidus TaxID=2576776 RepID=A0A507ZQW2_9FLAO|nr:hypothetical protein [Haloflavibacter putidus]TQD38664.1 hypothetical protein FKR84_08435 [Haloflavibacter putidus]
MSDEIRNHYDQDDIQKLNLDKDIKSWQNEITFINTELDFFKKNIQFLLVDAQEVQNELLEKIKNLRERNNYYSLQLVDYYKDSEGIIECEDVHCETFYLNEHQSFKNELTQHVQRVRKLKREVFEQLLKKM